MLNVKTFVAVSGVSGVSKLISARKDGLIIENFDTKERNFVPTRGHEFSPLETISIYTNSNEDVATIAQVFTAMKEQLAENPPPSEKADSPALRKYFALVLPDFDRDRVHISDIKKVIKWFTFLNARDLLKEAVEAPKAEEVVEEAAEKSVAEAEVEPKKEAKKKK